MSRERLILPALVISFVLVFSLAFYDVPAQPRTVLNVPYRRQGPCQCGPAALYMVLKYWEDEVTYEEIVDAIWHRDVCLTFTSDMVSYARKKGFHVVERLSTAEDLKTYIDQGFPVIVLQKVSTSNPRGHFRVVVGYDDKGFIVHDPQLSPNYHISYELFVELWSPGSTFYSYNWSMVVLPEDLWSEEYESVHSEAYSLLELAPILVHAYGLSDDVVDSIVEKLSLAEFEAHNALFKRAEGLLGEVRVELLHHLESHGWVWEGEGGLRVYVNLEGGYVQCDKADAIYLVATLSGRLVNVTNVSVSVDDKPLPLTPVTTYCAAIDVNSLCEASRSKEPTLTLKVPGAKPLSVTLTLKGVHLLTIKDSFRGVEESRLVPSGHTELLEAPPSPIEFGNRTRYVFKGWLVNGQLRTDGSITVVNDTTIVYVWSRQYLVTVESSPFVEGREEWVDEGSKLKLAVENQTLICGDGARLVFESWIVDGKWLESPEVEVEVRGPTNVSVAYHHEYYVEVLSEYGAVEGSGWYREGEYAVIKLSSTKIEGLIYDLVFDYWELGGSVLSRDPSVRVLVNHPLLVRAVWRRDYTKLYIIAVLAAILAQFLLRKKLFKSSTRQLISKK